MSRADLKGVQALAYSLLQSALAGPYLPEDHPPNLANWVGAQTPAWKVLMFFKQGVDEKVWFCHADIEWQRTFLMIVAVELLHTTETGEIA